MKNKPSARRSGYAFRRVFNAYFGLSFFSAIYINSVIFHMPVIISNYYLLLFIIDKTNVIYYTYLYVYCIKFVLTSF